MGGGWLIYMKKIIKRRKFGLTLTRILANPNIQPLAKIVLRNELERYIKSSKGGKPYGKQKKVGRI